MIEFDRKWLCVCAGIALAAFTCMLAIVASSGTRQVTEAVFLLLAAIALFFTTLSIIGYRQLQTARLIMENQILYICQARIISKSQKEKSIDVYISCFGILLDFRVIKFNQNNVHLKSVEIGNDFIYLSYGHNDKIQTIQFLHSLINEGELADVMGKFKYETGVIPRIIK